MTGLFTKPPAFQMGLQEIPLPSPSIQEDSRWADEAYSGDYGLVASMTTSSVNSSTFFWTYLDKWNADLLNHSCIHSNNIL